MLQTWEVNMHKSVFLTNETLQIIETYMKENKNISFNKAVNLLILANKETEMKRDIKQILIGVKKVYKHLTENKQ